MIEAKGPDGAPWYTIDVPILGTIRDCEPTEFGWRGIMPDGRAIEVRSAHPGVHDHLRWLRWVGRDKCVGVYLIERRRRKRARR